MSPAFIVLFSACAFGLGLISDYLSTRYTRAVHAFEISKVPADRERARSRAALTSVAILLVGSLGLFSVVEVGWWLLLPEGAGFYVGTKLAMR